MAHDQLVTPRPTEQVGNEQVKEVVAAAVLALAGNPTSASDWMIQGRSFLPSS